MSPISSDDAPYVVPDFAADAEVQAQYDVVAKALLTAAVADALRKMKDEYELELMRLEANKRAANTVYVALDRHAHSLRSKYARLVPKGRTASGIVSPPTLFFDTILTMGQANKLYAQAREAAELKREAQIKVRSSARDLAAHVGKIESALVVRELEIRTFYKTASGRMTLNEDPRLHELAVACAEIETERSDYRRRLESGEVSDEERRDRTMAADGYRYLDGEVRGLHCLNQREIRFGTLRYLMFRDRDDKIWLLEYGMDVLPLAQMRFDVLHRNERYLIQRAPAPATKKAEPARSVHTGPDPRASTGVEPLLRLALKNFVAREKSAG